MSVPLALLAAKLPAGPKALAALVDAHGGRLTALYEVVDRMLGGDGRPRSTGYKVMWLVKSGWLVVDVLPSGKRLMRFPWIKKPVKPSRPRSDAYRSAHGIVARARSSGALFAPVSCSACDQELPLVAHHDDYSRPLDVRWLCRPCHHGWHLLHGPAAHAYTEAP